MTFPPAHQLNLSSLVRRIQTSGLLDSPTGLIASKPTQTLLPPAFQTQYQTAMVLAANATRGSQDASRLWPFRDGMFQEHDNNPAQNHRIDYSFPRWYVRCAPVSRVSLQPLTHEPGCGKPVLWRLLNGMYVFSKTVYCRGKLKTVYAPSSSRRCEGSVGAVPNSSQPYQLANIRSYTLPHHVVHHYLRSPSSRHSPMAGYFKIRRK